MNHQERSPERLPDEKALSLINEALKKVGQPEAGPRPESVTSEGHRVPRVRILPPWVERVGFLGRPDRWCLWCEPRTSSSRGFPGQVVIDVRRGRYMVETLDGARSTWVSRESAEGGPLVIGLPYTGSPILVLIRRIE